MALKDAETKPIDTAQIRELGVVEMRDELQRLEEAQFRLRYRAATTDVTDGNPLRFRILRRNIARLKTILREQESHG
jgi:large subunit ribosomal protein L29